MKILAITQARVGSSRLPGKVLKTIGKKTLLELHLQRASQSVLIDKLVVATTTEPDANKIVAIANRMGIDVYQGSVDDVLDRFYQTARHFQAEYVVRITSDCPLVDGDLVDKIIRFAMEKQVDYVSNTLETTFPDGQDVEVFRFAALEKAWTEATLNSEREHVTSYIWKNSTWFNKQLFSSANFRSKVNYEGVRMTVDEQIDLETIEILVDALGEQAGWEEYTQHYLVHETIMRNKRITRNEGYLKSLGTEN